MGDKPSEVTVVAPLNLTCQLVHDQGSKHMKRCIPLASAVKIGNIQVRPHFLRISLKNFAVHQELRQHYHGQPNQQYTDLIIEIESSDGVYNPQ